jgi:rRNA-processing protein FCF1
MAAIPAQVAGVPEIVVATPPRGGELNDTILAAAQIANVNEVYAIGGAQAIGALAYGTDSVPRVDKILGPGGIYVVLAKRRVFGAVAIDQLPGPTETLLIADESANVEYVAADMLAQAEHDPLASALLLTPSETVALAVREAVARQIQSLGRNDTIRASLAARGGVVVVRDIDEALDLANEYASEHLCLLTANPWELLGRVKNAGGVFVGELSSEPWAITHRPQPHHAHRRHGRFLHPSTSGFVKITSVFGVGPKRPARSARPPSPSPRGGPDGHSPGVHARATKWRKEAPHEHPEQAPPGRSDRRTSEQAEEYAPEPPEETARRLASPWGSSSSWTPTRIPTAPPGSPWTCWPALAIPTSTLTPISRRLRPPSASTSASTRPPSWRATAPTNSSI